MSYSRVGTPRFFIDLPLFARYHNLIVDHPQNTDVLTFSPTKTKNLALGHDNSQMYYDALDFHFDDSCWINSMDYCFYLGHKFFTDNIFGSIYSKSISGGWVKITKILEEVNCYVDLNSITATPIIVPDTDGWSMIRFNKFYEDDLELIRILIGGHLGESELNQPFQLGDVSCGWTYEMPHSPELSLKLSYVNESIKTQTTRGGVTLTDEGYGEPPYWLNKPQWMINDGSAPISNYRGASPNVRRIWDLSFSYLQDTDLLNENYNGKSNRHFGLLQSRTSVDGSQIMGIKDSFYSKVYHGSCGFKNPFIFQPNKDVTEFAIVRIDGNSFTIDQVANNVYNVSLKLIETW